LEEVHAKVEAYMEWEHLGDPNDPGRGEEPESVGELELYWLWRRYASLPLAGGLMDQPHITLDLMNLCGNLDEQYARVARNLKRSNNVPKATEPP
jgi:hypothetical protein